MEETAVKVNGQLITIKVKQCLVIPQPVGTQYYLVKKEIINKEDRILIIDGGTMLSYSATRRHSVLLSEERNY
nr:hypothetical protein [Bacillus thuringiensis]